MTHQSTIAERIGANKHSYIPPAYRDENISRYDGDGKRAAILAYIKANHGEILDQGEMAETLNISRSNVINHIRNLVKAKKITVERAGAKRRYWYGVVPTRSNGETVVKTPGKPVSRTNFKVLREQAMDYLETLEDPTAHALGVMGFLKHLKRNSPEE